MENFDTLFNKILANGPSPGTLFLVLSSMKEQGQVKRVIQHCYRALDIYPDDIPIRRLLAEAYLESGRISQAETEMDKVITRIDDLISSYSIKAEILIRQKREKEAVETLKLYLAHRPDDKEALRLLDVLQPPEEISEEPEPAKEEETVPRPPQEEGAIPDIATPTLAEVYFDQGRIKEAIETYEKVLAENPDEATSKQRLDELKGMLEKDQPEEDREEDRIRQKKIKMIAVLEDWLASIREQSKTDISVA